MPRQTTSARAKDPRINTRFRTSETSTRRGTPALQPDFISVGLQLRAYKFHRTVSCFLLVGQTVVESNRLHGSSLVSSILAPVMHVYEVESKNMFPKFACTTAPVNQFLLCPAVKTLRAMQKSTRAKSAQVWTKPY